MPAIDPGQPAHAGSSICPTCKGHGILDNATQCQTCYGSGGTPPPPQAGPGTTWH
jgi:DnaJ-class molecular chaperone